MIAFYILAALLLKHFICDFPLQAHPWLYSRKGEYGAPGGLVHAGIHGLATAVVLWFFPLSFHAVCILALLDFGVHYHIDFMKMWLNKKLDLRPDNSEWFWILLGADQLLHHATYVALAWMATAP